MALIKIVMVKMKSSLVWMEMEMAFRVVSIVMTQNQIYTPALEVLGDGIDQTVMVSM